MTGKLAEISEELNRQSGFNHMPSLIFLTDQKAQLFPENIIENMPIGSAVILRDYDAANRYELAVALRYICKSRQIKFLVAKDLGLALSIEADGIHLPEFAIKDALEIRKECPDYIITGSAHTEKAIKRCIEYGINGILFSPIFTTKSHPETFNDPKLIIGTDRLRQACETNNIPIYALGGITDETAQNLSGTGVTGIAVIRGLEA